MRYLLDTNIFMFFIDDREKLSRNVRYILGDYSNLIYIPAESVKEVLYLLQSGKYHTPQLKSATDLVRFIRQETPFEIKHIDDGHLMTLSTLPFFKDHKDPTDRMIVAHAITENITLISSDREFPRYRRCGLELIYNEV